MDRTDKIQKTGTPEETLQPPAEKKKRVRKPKGVAQQTAAPISGSGGIPITMGGESIVKLLVKQ